MSDWATALITAGTAIAASAVTAFATVRAAGNAKSLAEYRARLGLYIDEVEAFRALEDAYSRELATPTRSAESVRREFRKRLRADGLPAPTDLSGPARIENERSRLAGDSN